MTPNPSPLPLLEPSSVVLIGPQSNHADPIFPIQHFPIMGIGGQSIYDANTDTVL